MPLAAQLLTPPSPPRFSLQCHMCFEGEGPHAELRCRAVCCALCFSATVLAQSSATSDRLKGNLGLNCAVPHVCSHPQTHTHAQQHPPLLSRVLSVPQGWLAAPGRRLPILAGVCDDSVPSSLLGCHLLLRCCVQQDCANVCFRHEVPTQFAPVVVHSSHCTQL